MHIEYLYYFRDFAENLSITKAAELNYMTPQGLSRAIHQMEKDFGLSLMIYQNHTATLTPAGKELASRAERITQLYDELRGSLTQYKLAEVKPSNEIIRVTITSCVAQYLISLLNLQKPGRFPFSVKITESNLYRIVPKIVAKEQEESMGILSLPDTEKYQRYLGSILIDNKMLYQPLLTTPLVALISAYSPLASKSLILAEDLRPYPVTRFRDTVLGDALDDFIFEDNVKTVTNASSVVYSQILEHQAVGFAPKLIEGMRTLPEGIVTRPVDGFFNTTFGILMNQDALSSRRISQLISYIEDKLSESMEDQRYKGTFSLIE